MTNIERIKDLWKSWVSNKLESVKLKIWTQLEINFWDWYETNINNNIPTNPCSEPLNPKNTTTSQRHEEEANNDPNLDELYKFDPNSEPYWNR